MAERVVWGLDIGQMAIRAVKLVTRKIPKSKEPVITMIDTFFYDLNTTLDDPEYIDKVREGLSEFAANKSPTAHEPVVLSVAGTNALFRSFTVPPVPAGKLREVVSYEARQLIPYPLEEVVWDFQNLGFDDDSGELQIALVCCRQEIVDELLQIFDHLKIKVADVQIAPLALVNFCRYDFYSEGRMLLLDCGARSTDFVIFDDAMFWLRSIPVCGSDITRALMSKFNISYEDAEQLKTNTADEKQAARVFKTLEPIMRNLTSEVQRSIGFYRSTKRDANVDELILAGNSFLLAGADQYMADALGYGARTLDLPQNIEIGDEVDGNEILLHRQVYGVATGLALQGLGLAVYDCSLLPEDRKLAKLIKSKEIYGWVAAAIVAITVILELMLAGGKAPMYQEEVNKIKTALAKSQSSYGEYNQKLEQFKPAQKINSALINTEAGRGMILVVTDRLYRAFGDFNQRQQRGLALPNSDSKMREYEKSAVASIDNFKPSSDRYKKLFAEKKKEFEKDYTSISGYNNAKELEKEMDANLNLQILRRVFLQHQRLRRVFLDRETYFVMMARKTTNSDGSVTWEVDDKELKERLPAVDDGGGGGEQVAEVVEEEVDETEVDGGEEVVVNKGGKSSMVPVVIVDITGFLVDGGDGKDVAAFTELRQALQGLGSKEGFHLLPNSRLEGGFVQLHKVTKNLINLPRIYSPLPKQVRDEDLGERGSISHSEKLDWDATEEVVRGFHAQALFEPRLAKAEKKETDELMEKISPKKVTPPTPEKTDEPAEDKTEATTE